MDNQILRNIVLALPDDEKVVLMETIMDSLTQNEDSILEAHIDEAKTRLANFKTGKTQTFTLSEIIDTIE